MPQVNEISWFKSLSFLFFFFFLVLINFSNHFITFSSKMNSLYFFCNLF